MKLQTLRLGLVATLFVIGFSSVASFGQRGPVRGPVQPARDPERETLAQHNLEVARWYLIRRKAYAGAVDRLKEIIETYPEFSRMDEVTFLMGEAHLKLEKPEVAGDYYNKLVKEYPDSELVKKAQERLAEIKGPKG